MLLMLQVITKEEKAKQKINENRKAIELVVKINTFGIKFDRMANSVQ